MQPTRRWFFAPSRDGLDWEVVEATKVEAGWKLRRPGKITQEVVADVPPVGAKWREVKAPLLPPPSPKVVESPTAGPVKDRTAQGRPPRPPMPKGLVVKAPPGPEPARKPVPPKQMPKLSRALEDLLAEEQKSAPAPAGMVKCPVCGVAVEPTRNKRVRTHDDPLKGARCEASNKPWAEFGLTGKP